MRRRTSSAIALAAVAGLLLSGCSQGVGMNRVQEGARVAIGVLDTATTANAQDAALGSPEDPTASAEQLVHAIAYAPVHLRTSPTVQFNTDFISVETASSDPLTVRYRLAEGVAWSDAVPTDDADLLLAWAAASEHFAPEGFERADHLTGDGQLDVPEGTAWFDSAWSPLQQGTAVPVLGSDHRTVDIAYDEPALEWDLGIRSVLPAHVVAQQALGISDPMVAKHAVRDAILGEDVGTVALLSDAYREIFALRGGVGAGAQVSNGQYRIDSVEASGAVVLKPNKEFRVENGGLSEEIRVVPFESPGEMLDALRAGQINVAMPGGTIDVWDEVSQMDRRGYRALDGSTQAFTRLDFNIAAGRHDHLFANRDVRRAFLSAIDTASMFGAVTDVFSGATSRSSWVFPPGHEEAPISAQRTGFAQLSAMDEERSDAVLDRAGIQRREACVLFDARSPLHAAQFAVMREAAAERDWRLEDCSRDDWEAALAEPDAWDVALTVDATSAQRFDLLAASFETDGALNYSGFSSPELDALLETARHEADPYQSLDALHAIDALLVEEVVALPMQQELTIAVYADTVKGASLTDAPPYIGQDAYGWEVSG